MKLYSVFLLVFLSISLSCSRKHLAVFFDGVPTEESAAAIPDSTVNRQEILPEKQQTQPEAEKILSIHPDYLKKKCEKCHLTQHANRLNNKEPELCNQCHDDFIKSYPFVHGPVAAGLCNACHLPHKSVNKSLLKLSVREICQYCHNAGDVDKNKAHEKTSHITCRECHNAHGGQTAHLLKNDEVLK